MLRLAATAAATAAALVLAAPASAQNGWTYEEPGNACAATRSANGDWVQIHLTRWNDLSDSILLHRPGLNPLWSEEGYPSGRTEAQEDADENVAYGLEVRIDGRPVEAVSGFTTMLLNYGGRPGPTYRFGLRQQAFLRALATGRTLQLYRHGQRLAAIPIRGMATTARRMAICVDLPTR